jgi:hypothetical protein
MRSTGGGSSRLWSSPHALSRASDAPRVSEGRLAPQPHARRDQPAGRVPRRDSFPVADGRAALSSRSPTVTLTSTPQNGGGTPRLLPAADHGHHPSSPARSFHAVGRGNATRDPRCAEGPIPGQGRRWRVARASRHAARRRQCATGVEYGEGVARNVGVVGPCWRWSVVGRDVESCIVRGD